MIDPNLPTPEPPAPEPPAPRSPKLVCEFCSCQLTPAGDVLRMSDAAREYARQADVLRDARRDVSAAESKLAEVTALLETAQREILSLKSPAEPAGFFRKVVQP